MQADQNRHIRPSYEEIEAFAAQGSYGCVPVSTEILADTRTPMEVLRILKNVSGHCFLLESAAEHESWGRYTFLGYDPVLSLSCKDGKMKIGSVSVDTKDPNRYIRQILQQHSSPVIPYLPPFTGGFAGYFSYDYLKYAEPSLCLDAKDTEGFMDVDLMLFDKLIAFDHYRQKMILMVNMKLDHPKEEYRRACLQLDMMKKLIRRGETSPEEPGQITGQTSALFDRASFCSMVEKAKQYIFEGDIFQVVLSNRLEAPFSGSLLNMYRVLRTVNPSPYMFYFSGSDIEAAGASPETLVKLQDGVLHTFPLAGTRPRGLTEEEDRRLEQELLGDPKELAEHSMLVDLGRNDLGKISRFGTVAVEKAYQVQRYSHVMHIGSTVRGQIREDKDALDAVDAVLPAGTLSGAPKIRACQIINELEDNRRGIYGGAVGYISLTGNLDLCIAIRLAYKKNGKVFVRSGAGIVADSVPEKEYQECVNKAAAVLRSLQQASELAKEEADDRTD